MSGEQWSPEAVTPTWVPTITSATPYTAADSPTVTVIRVPAAGGIEDPADAAAAFGGADPSALHSPAALTSGGAAWVGGRPWQVSGSGGRGQVAPAVLAVVGICALLGGLWAFTAGLGGAKAGPAAASSIAPGGMAVAGTAVSGTGVKHSRAVGHGHTGNGVTRKPVSGAGRHADPFTAAMTAYLAGRAGTVVAAVYDESTGQTWTLGDGGPQATGSIVKVEILQALLARYPDGLTPADRTLARAMIENNDNDAGTTLWNAVGRSVGLRSYDLSAGLRRTTPSACLVCAGFGWPGWGLTTTTPADQLRLLRELVDGPLLSLADRAYALSLMENVEPDQGWGVSAGLPAGVRVALKNAWVPLSTADADWQINSVGWVDGDGRDYLVAVLTTGNPNEEYGIETIDVLSTMLWIAMGQGGLGRARWGPSVRQSWFH
jgi:hypothetical protein